MEQTINAQIDQVFSEQNQMIERLYRYCNVNSGSDNLNGLEKMLHLLKEDFQPIADNIQIRQLPPFSTVDMQGQHIKQNIGNALLIRKRPHLKRRILLSGHMDTVYSTNHPFQTLKYSNDHEINGPGVADMKGGLIVIHEALSHFENTQQAESLGWDVLINADEEIGSPGSSNLINELASSYQAALVYEPAMTKSGILAKNRKGSGKLSLIATGKAAHAGRAFFDGRNAICYLSEIITEVHQLNGLRDGVTINVGLVSGGEALNIVPEKAVAKLDIRISAAEDEQWVMQQLHAIKEKKQKSDYSLAIEGNFSRPVKRVSKGTERLFHRLQQQGNALGINLDWKDSGGCCDGNNLAYHGLPVLDTLGVRGGFIHSPEEFIVLDSLGERAALSVLLLNDLAQGGLEDINYDVTS